MASCAAVSVFALAAAAPAAQAATEMVQLAEVRQLFWRQRAMHVA